MEEHIPEPAPPQSVPFCSICFLKTLFSPFSASISSLACLLLLDVVFLLVPPPPCSLSLSLPKHVLAATSIPIPSLISKFCIVGHCNRDDLFNSARTHIVENMAKFSSDLTPTKCEELITNQVMPFHSSCYSKSATTVCFLIHVNSAALPLSDSSKYTRIFSK